MPAPSLSLRDFLLALAVIVVWGTNFSVIRVGLDHLPPLLFAALRFTFALIPAVFFLKRPDVPWWKLAAYGLLIGPGQFTEKFTAMPIVITTWAQRPQEGFVALTAAAIIVLVKKLWIREALGEETELPGER